MEPQGPEGPLGAIGDGLGAKAPAPEGVVDLVGDKAGLEGPPDDLVEAQHPHDLSRVTGLDQQEAEGAARLGPGPLLRQAPGLSRLGIEPLLPRRVKGGEGRPVAAVKGGRGGGPPRGDGCEAQPRGAEYIIAH